MDVDDWSGGKSASCIAVPSARARATDGRIRRCGIISSCQSTTTAVVESNSCKQRALHCNKWPDL